MNKILQSISKIWNFLPLFQKLLLWLNKTPAKWDPPLSVQEGFDISFLKYYFLTLFDIIGKPIDNILGNTKFILKKKLVVVRSFCFGLSYFLPLWHESPKTESLEPFLTTFSPLVINRWVKFIPKMESLCFVLMLSPPRVESDLERRRRMSYGVEAFVFAEDSNSLSIHLWLGLKKTRNHISHSIWKRYDQRYVRWAMCANQQKKFRESRIFSSCLSLLKVCSSRGLVKISANWSLVLM